MGSEGTGERPYSVIGAIPRAKSRLPGGSLPSSPRFAKSSVREGGNRFRGEGEGEGEVGDGIGGEGAREGVRGGGEVTSVGGGEGEVGGGIGHHVIEMKGEKEQQLNLHTGAQEDNNMTKNAREKMETDMRRRKGSGIDFKEMSIPWIEDRGIRKIDKNSSQFFFNESMCTDSELTSTDTRDTIVDVRRNGKIENYTDEERGLSREGSAVLVERRESVILLDPIVLRSVPPSAVIVENIPSQTMPSTISISSLAR